MADPAPFSGIGMIGNWFGKEANHFGNWFTSGWKEALAPYQDILSGKGPSVPALPALPHPADTMTDYVSKLGLQHQLAGLTMYGSQASTFKGGSALAPASSGPKSALGGGY